ncbi:MAG: ferritin-like protein [Flavobacteriaceae bacterium]|nr:ferritin-like protein [Flavobacteriaceae bacterium]
MDGTLFQLVKDVTTDNLKDAMQQAIEIEIATIPVYLFTYYSIKRTQNQSQLQQTIFNDFKTSQKLKKNPISDTELDEAAETLARYIMVFANKAGALIMSVAIEEMLHMALSSNIKNALGKYGGLPELVNKTPKVWPAYLPGHIPSFPINRAKLSLDQLHTFLLIESPLPFTDGGHEKGAVIEYQTIGKYYDMIIDCIKNNLKDSDFDGKAPQLISSQYYNQNNIDTIYYDKDHKPQFANGNHSGGLIHVKSIDTALEAMHEIIEQGEGASHTTKDEKKKIGNHLTTDGKVVCPMDDKFNPLSYDDKEKDELSHFDKFLDIYCSIERENAKIEKFLGVDSFDFTKYFVKNLPENPKTSDYPEAIQKISNLTNAIYTYLFIMTEACYKTDGHKQFEIFMFGIHKSMIWLLDNLAGTMSGLTYINPSGQLSNVSVTFEDYPFNRSTSPKSQIIALAKEAMSVGNTIGQVIMNRIQDLPDVPLESYLENQSATN